KVRLEAFRNYVRFCENLGIPRSEPNDSLAHLTGIRNVDSLRFVILNSAWYCTGSQRNDQGKLWLGRPTIDELDLPQVHDDRNAVITIGLCHHPSLMLHRQ